MKSKILSLMLAGGLMLSGSLAAFADHYPEYADRKDHRQEMQDEFFDATDATDAQKEKLRAVQAKYAPQISSVRQDLMRQQKDLTLYIFTPEATEADAKTRQEKMVEGKAKLDELMLQAAFEKKAILTPEQQVKARAFWDKEAAKVNEKIQDKEN